MGEFLETSAKLNTGIQTAMNEVGWGNAAPKVQLIMKMVQRRTELDPAWSPPEKQTDPLRLGADKKTRKRRCC